MKATMIGFSAILMWGMLALLTTLTNKVPPLQLTALTFTIAFVVGLLFWALKGADSSCFRQPMRVWLNGVCGLFGFHLFYFIALKNAPAVDASLISYLWPLFIVIFSALLPREKLHWFHLSGALLGFAGASVIILKGNTLNLKSEYIVGYVAAFICSLIWSAYSVISRKIGNSPTELVGGFCGVTALLSVTCHLLFESTVKLNFSEWLAVIAMGIGPVGAAFFAWDYGVKHGNIKMLGALSYAAPLISTMLLISFGRAEPSLNSAIACLMIVCGAALAALDTIKQYLGLNTIE
ncbi:aromatic amino acid exporter YddG [Geobacter pickeringii]|uniref:aromatic amino acid exporter YddG n=1 Tax=Geobacter pickeringii TaxID=345632 RepID=UPI000AF02F75|nr:EamA family transporter [Geobacter pickeringii]